MITVCPYQLQCTNFTKCCGVALTKCFSSTFSFGKNDKSEIHKNMHIYTLYTSYLHIYMLLSSFRGVGRTICFRITFIFCKLSKFKRDITPRKKESDIPAKMRIYTSCTL